MKYFLGLLLLTSVYFLAFINMAAEEQIADSPPINEVAQEPQKELTPETPEVPQTHGTPHANLQTEIEEVTKQLQEEIKKNQETLNPQMEAQQQYISPERIIHVILAPRHRTVLSSQVSNPGIATPILHIYHRMGEIIEKDELLIKIQDDVFRASLEKATAALARYQAALYAKKQLFDDDLASFLDVKEAQANVAAAKAELTLAELQVSFCNIRSPYNGKVVGLSIEEHELPQPGQPLIELVDEDALFARSLVPSSKISSLVIGKMLKIRINETQTVVEAPIIRIGAIIDPASSTIAMEAEIDNSEGLLRAGMTGVTTVD